MGVLIFVFCLLLGFQSLLDSQIKLLCQAKSCSKGSAQNIAVRYNGQKVVVAVNDNTRFLLCQTNNCMDNGVEMCDDELWLNIYVNAPDNRREEMLCKINGQPSKSTTLDVYSRPPWVATGKDSKFEVDCKYATRLANIDLNVDLDDLVYYKTSSSFSKVQGLETPIGFVPGRKGDGKREYPHLYQTGNVTLDKWESRAENVWRTPDKRMTTDFAVVKMDQEEGNANLRGARILTWCWYYGMVPYGFIPRVDLSLTQATSKADRQLRWSIDRRPAADESNNTGDTSNTSNQKYVNTNDPFGLMCNNKLESCGPDEKGHIRFVLNSTIRARLPGQDAIIRRKLDDSAYLLNLNAFRSDSLEYDCNDGEASTFYFDVWLRQPAAWGQSGKGRLEGTMETCPDFSVQCQISGKFAANQEIELLPELPYFHFPSTFGQPVFRGALLQCYRQPNKYKDEVKGIRDLGQGDECRELSN